MYDLHTGRDTAQYCSTSVQGCVVDQPGQGRGRDTAQYCSTSIQGCVVDQPGQGRGRDTAQYSGQGRGRDTAQCSTSSDVDHSGQGRGRDTAQYCSTSVQGCVDVSNSVNRTAVDCLNSYRSSEPR